MDQLSRAAYRVWQFWHAIRPRLSKEDRRVVLEALPTNLRPIFFAMPLREQSHSVAVMRQLRQAGCSDQNLLRAALLHDVGKGNPRLWQRVAFVLLMALVPDTTERTLDWDVPGLGWLRVLLTQDSTGRAVVDAAGGCGTISRIVGGSPSNSSEAFQILLLRAVDDAC